MDDNTPLIRMCYRASDVLVVAQYNQTELWHQVHNYTDQHTWLQQVYRTLIENNQFTACLHIITGDTPSSVWQSACIAVIAASEAIQPCLWSHVICTTDGADIADAENWVRRAAWTYAHKGQRINGIESSESNIYVNYLLHHDSQLISGAFWNENGRMTRNGCIHSERILAHYWITHVSPQQSIHMS
jgi:hypothetical protein